jgi:glucose/arabinose dehydrogenase
MAPLVFANGDTNELIAPIEKGDLSIQLVSVADGLAAPVWGTAAPGDSRHLFVADQDGIVWAIDLEDKGRGKKGKDDAKVVFLDIRHRLVNLGIGGPGTYDERGLLGLAFHPKYRRNGLFYTYTTEPAGNKAPDFSTMPPGQASDHHNLVIEWQARNPKNPKAGVFKHRARVLLRIDQPQFNHNGGGLAFGPDGMLYISTGDGGNADDQGPGHGETGNGQDAGNVLGAVLRIDPQGRNSSNGEYGIPPDNPFLNDPEKVDEIFAYGFRNPYRFSFDRPTGKLYLADVGQHDVEEVDVVVSGGNYGWNLKEGSFFFHPEGEDEDGHALPEPDEDRIPPDDVIDPIGEYEGHVDGHAIIGGFVYRGNKIPQLAGQYVFGDFSLEINDTFTVFEPGSLYYLDVDHLDGDPDGDGHPNEGEPPDAHHEGEEHEAAEHDEGEEHHGDVNEAKEFHVVGQENIGITLLGMGQDACGELYALGNTTGTPFGTTGVVLKLVNGAGDDHEKARYDYRGGDRSDDRSHDRKGGRSDDHSDDRDCGNR